MAVETTRSAEISLSLTEEQRGCLEQMLDSALRETHSEAHHTDNRDYRESVRHQEAVLRSLLEKVQQAGTV